MSKGNGQSGPARPAHAQVRHEAVTPVSPAATLDREAAWKRACEMFGSGAVIGFDGTVGEPFYVGRRGRFGRWVQLGRGVSFAAAFEAVVDVGGSPRPERSQEHAEQPSTQGGKR